jgi:hypothetical protein
MNLQPNDTIPCANAADFYNTFKELRRLGYKVQCAGAFKIKILEKDNEITDEE